MGGHTGEDNRPTTPAASTSIGPPGDGVPLARDGRHGVGELLGSQAPELRSIEGELLVQPAFLWDRGKLVRAGLEDRSDKFLQIVSAGHKVARQPVQQFGT